MGDLISRKALIAEYDRVHIGPPGGARKLIEEAPAVDAVEVKHKHCLFCKPHEEKCGTCIKFFDYYLDGGSDKCSATYTGSKCVAYEPVDYCPCCGSKMDLEPTAEQP